MAANGRIWLERVTLAVWAGVLVLSAVPALELVGRTFPGFVAARHGQVDMIMPSAWTGFQAGVRPDDQVLSLDGQPFVDQRGFYMHARALPAGTPVRYELLRQGRALTLTCPTDRFGWRDLLLVALPFWLGGLLHLALGWWVRAARPDSEAARAHWLYCQAVALYLLSNLEGDLTGWLFWPTMVGITAALPTITWLALVFPRPLGSAAARRGVVGLASALALVCMGLVVYAFEGPRWRPELYAVGLGLPCLVFLAALASWAWQGVARGQAAAQARVVFLGGVVGFVPTIVVFLSPHLGGSGPLPYDPGTLGFVAFPGAVAYAILRHGGFALPLAWRRALAYAIVTLALGAVYAGVVTAGALLAGDAAEATGFLAALAVAIACRPLHDRVRAWVDRRFLGERAQTAQTLATFHGALAREPGRAAQLLLAELDRALRPAWVRCLGPQGQLLALGQAPERPDPAALIVPLAAGSERFGQVEVGPRIPERPYPPDDQQLVAALAGLAAAALNLDALTRRDAEVRREVEDRTLLLKQVVHDIRADLFNIAGASEELEELAPDSPAIGVIQRSLARIQGLLAEKGPQSKIATGVRLQAGLSGTIEAVSGLVARNHQKLEFQPPATDPRLGVSAVELAQIMVNILENASKYAPPGSTIRVRAWEVDGAAWVEVLDEGEGFVEAVAPAAAGFGESLGLGLGNVRALLERRGGALQLGNGPVGARVLVKLPCS